ncbi:LPS export ABC transporter periplasmic protein LptC [uncultured Shimia sp.]|uniref:LPS export ABC transporter periplasmic protein LptC n=1 Tax=uncultured Shimia sp. TaxID=573152 RepID=UPI00263892C1|nr:LPS export ABC transporter periplasmic protein LptC [uncultured Shimia sp.]
MVRRLTYSNLVAWLKVLLPLTALGILSTLFLISHEVDLESAIPFADVELEKRLRDRQITAPYISGKTNDGHHITLTSATAHPDIDDPSRIIADQVGALISTTEGTEITVRAEAGEMSSTFNEVELAGEVEVVTSAGYTITTDSMLFGLEDARAETAGSITAESALGTLEAGRMALRPSGENNEIYLFFTKGVRLVYTPQNETR